MTLTQLEYIVAVAKHGNFRVAAKSCFVTQPTLSMQIQKLEDQLGVKIFDRSQQPIQATPIGQKILDQARVVLSQSALIGELIKQEKQEIAGDLSLAIIPTLAPYLLPLFLQDFSARYPAVRLHVEESKTDSIIEALRQNRLDVGLLVTPLSEPLIRECPLFEEPFYVYTSRQNPLAALDLVEEKDLREQDMLLLTEGHCMREQVLSICRSRQSRAVALDAPLQFESGSIETLCHLVENGKGYTIIPHLAKIWQENRPGKVIAFADPCPSREVSLACHQSYVKESLLQALIQCIRANLPESLQHPHHRYRTLGIR